jgi:chaperonin cofactor prefoldin
MWWFHKNKRLQDDHDVDQKDSIVEVIAHKKATKQQINETKKINKELNRIFADNHFTLKIYLANKQH